MNTNTVATQRPLWKRPNVRRLRHIIVAVIVLGAALYFLPVLTLLFILCGFLDFSRHQTITTEAVEKYFTGNGITTWALSPINLLTDLFCPRNKIIYKLEDLPAEHRAEIETCVREFIANGDAIKAHVA